jgi:two-component system, LuxR family, sensor kinase FixL
VATRPYDVRFDADRVSDLLERLERLVARDPTARLEISSMHDELDAIAFGINALADELRWAYARISDAERAKSDALHEEMLKRSAANFATAFNSNPCAMAIVRMSDGRFQDVNASFERQTGFSRNEVLGRTIAEFGMWVDPDDIATIVTAICQGGLLESREVRYRSRSGTVMTAVYSADVIEFGDGPCILAAGQDVTERRRTETHAALLREELAHLGRLTMLDTLTASLAHEINQPLTALSANADAALLMLTAQPPRWRDLGEALTDIRRDSQRAGEIVRRIRLLSKKAPPQHDTLDLGTTVADVVKLAESNASLRRISLDVELPACGPVVRGDRTQIQQVVLNLLLNAFDAVQDRPAAERRVRLDVSRRDGAAAIDVGDCGAGLPDERMALLFEAFYTTKEEGLGLGLSICRAIVAAHDGTISASRNPGSGMTFSVTLPIVAPDDAAKSDSTAAPNLQRQD